MARIDAAFGFLADQLAITKDPWWVIGGATMYLLGLEKEAPKDIDVLVSQDDAVILDAHYRLPNLADAGNETFRSSWFVKFAYDGMPIEVFAGFQVRNGDDWHDILPQTQKEISFAAKKLYVPARNELIDIFELFGRPKDLVRAKVLANA